MRAELYSGRRNSLLRIIQDVGTAGLTHSSTVSNFGSRPFRQLRVPNEYAQLDIWSHSDTAAASRSGNKYQSNGDRIRGQRERFDTYIQRIHTIDEDCGDTHIYSRRTL